MKQMMAAKPASIWGKLEAEKLANRHFDVGEGSDLTVQ